MPLRYVQVRLKPPQYDYCLFNTTIAPSKRLLPLQYDYCPFNTTVAPSIRLLPLQYDCCPFNTTVAPSIRLLPDTTNTFPVRFTTLLYGNFVPYPPPYQFVLMATLFFYNLYACFRRAAPPVIVKLSDLHTHLHTQSNKHLTLLSRS